MQWADSEVAELEERVGRKHGFKDQQFDLELLLDSENWLEIDNSIADGVPFTIGEAKSNP